MIDRCLYFVTGAVLCISLSSFVMGVISIIVGKLIGCKVFLFKYLFWDYHLENGVPKVNCGQFSPICQYSTGKMDISKKEDFIQIIVIRILYTMLAGVAVVFIFHLWQKSQNTMYSKLIEVLVGAGFWLLFDVVLRWFMAIQMLLTSDKRLFRYTKDIALRLHQGFPMEEMSLPPYKELGRKGNKTEILQYDSFRFIQKVWMHQYDALQEIVEECDTIFCKDGYVYVRALTNVYYNMIFYYSYMGSNREKAAFYYNLVKKDLENDMDSNGRRVLAYYTYFCMGDGAAAMQMVRAGKEGLPKFSISQWERDYERMLLEELETRIFQEISTPNA